MVLRKRAPPHLYNLSQGNARSEPRSPVSQISPASISVSSSSPKRLTRPRRAQSSPHPRRIPSQESVYSPDLNTSPAFALMSLEQAQRSPIRTSTSDTPNPWADELVEKPDQNPQNLNDLAHQQGANSDAREGGGFDNRKGDRVPPIVVAGTQRRMAANEWQATQGVPESSDWEYLGQPPVQLQSNNPFLKVTQLEQNSWEDGASRSSYGSASPDNASGRLGHDEGYIPMTARLSLFDTPESDHPWTDEHGTSATQNRSFRYQETDNNLVGITQSTHTSLGARYSEQDVQPTLESQSSAQTGINTPRTRSTTTTGSSHVLIELDEPPKGELESESNKMRLSKSVSDGTYEPYSTSQIGKSDAIPTLVTPNETIEPGETASSTLSQAPASDTEAKQQQEKRSETYSIRHISWQDSTGVLRESPVLVQNKNGPCPLLALVNALVLRAAGRNFPPPIVRALQTREQISLGLLIEALFDELITRLNPDDEFPDIEALSQFLTMLHTGMNVNPRLTLESDEEAGTFLQTGDIKLYSTFGVPLVHGWIASPSTDANVALARVGQYHEDIQLLPFRKQELEDRVFQGATLSPEEERLMGDIHAIQHFTDVENATQLSQFGLEHLEHTLKPGSFSILFRNDHFSTLYKHPQLHQLFTLVTDAGYSSHAEIVWENLVDVNGSNAGFFAGDFRSVSHHATRTTGSSNQPTTRTRGNVPTASSQQNPKLSVQEQADADYAYALSLQFQEEELEGRNRTTGQRASAPNPSPGSAQVQPSAHSRSSSAVNVGSGRYTTPPRRHQSYSNPPQPRLESRQNGGDDDDAPPPSYEQSAQSPMYPSPQASPGITDTAPRLPYQQPQYRRRPIGAPISTGLPDRPRDRNKDCVLM